MAKQNLQMKKLIANDRDQVLEGYNQLISKME